MLGRDAFGMELDAMDGQAFVAEAHHARPVETGRFAGGVDHQAVGNILYHQRVIAGGGIGRGQVCENAAAVMGQIARLAVHQPAANHLAAEMLPDRLMAEADTQKRLSGGSAGGDEIEAHTRFIRRAGAGRYQIARRILGDGFFGSDGIVAHDLHLRAQFHEIMDEVEGEAVVIVDDEDRAVGSHVLR